MIWKLYKCSDKYVGQGGLSPTFFVSRGIYHQKTACGNLTDDEEETYKGSAMEIFIIHRFDKLNIFPFCPFCS
jgi:hypothetical protein